MAIKHQQIFLDRLDWKQKRGMSLFYKLMMLSDHIQVGIPRCREIKLRLPINWCRSFSEKHVGLFQELSKTWLPLCFSIPSRNLHSLKLQKTISRPAKHLHRFELPWGLTVHPYSGNVYTCEQNQSRVVCFDSSLNYLTHKEFKTPADQNHEYQSSQIWDIHLKGPRGIAISHDGRIAVADYIGSKVVLMTETFKLIKTITQSDQDQIAFKGPYHVCFDSCHNLYVADSNNRRVVKFDADGNHVCTFGGLDSPHLPSNCVLNGVLVDDYGFVYILYSNSDHVLVFKPDATLSRQIKINRIKSDSWGNLAWGPDDTFVVVDPTSNQIRFYTLNGHLRRVFLLQRPMGVAFGHDGTMFVTLLAASTLSTY
eukprot:TRINITY_DN20612_c0_g1_i1.p1 TRINITY_DN20612_c0_g1~~TRINITY_DN20612_c0_g1_i1.p1  ORF type:complete len:396 (-),score=58.07 TRINITY_DN20612_c0_g1_i1:266-1369(-)